MADGWVCARCDTPNESWRYWCQQCRATQEAKKTLPPPPVLQPLPAPVPDAPRPPASVALIVGVVLAVIAVGVGAFLVTRSSDSTTTATTAASGSPRLSAREEARLRDEQTADRLNFHQYDFPDSWKTDPNVNYVAVASGATMNRVAACGGLSDLSRPSDVVVESPTFTSGIFTAYSAVQITDDASTAASDYAQLTAADFLTCIHDVVVDNLGGPQVCACLDLAVTAVAFPPPNDAPANTYGFGLVITVHGQFVREMDGLFIADGRTELSLLFSGTTGPFPVDFGRQLITTELQRLKDNPTN